MPVVVERLAVCSAQTAQIPVAWLVEVFGKILTNGLIHPLLIIAARN